MKIIYVLIFSLFLVGCGQEGTPWNPKVVKVQKVAPAQSELYSYEFKGSSCTTGYQEFTTLDSACKTLLDNKANNYCQENKRLHLYETNC